MDYEAEDEEAEQWRAIAMVKYPSRAGGTTATENTSGPPDAPTCPSPLQQDALVSGTGKKSVGGTTPDRRYRSDDSDETIS